jgi:hypothetical protein
MRAAQLRQSPRRNHQRGEAEPGATPAKHQAAGRRSGEGPGPGPWLRGLRWVPVPLAALAAVIGALILGSFQGQVAAANARQSGYRAGGLALSVDTMLWMMNMTHNKGYYHMPQSQMPGYQVFGQNRLRVEVTFADVTTSAQQYSTSDFSLSSPSGKVWKVDGTDHSDMATSAVLEPGFQTIVNLYFDVPSGQSKNLTLKWSRGGTTVSIPINATRSGSVHM